MPRAKRAPIEYTPQFGGGIFRPKETVAEELAEFASAHDEHERLDPISDTTPEPPTETAADSASLKPKPERTNGRTSTGATFVRHLAGSTAGAERDSGRAL